MTRSRLARLAAVVVVGLAVTACGGSDEAAAPRELVVVETSTPDPLMVPGEAPGGLRPVEATVVPSDSPEWPRYVLFGEPSGELSDGKQIVAGTLFSSIYSVVGQGCAVRPGEAAQCGAWSVAVADFEGCEEDCYSFVLGRNTTVDEVQRAARAMTFDELTPQIPAASLPDGVVRLIDTPMAPYEFRAPGAQVVSYRPTESRRLSVTAVDGGGPLADLVRFFVAPDGSVAPFDFWSGSSSLAIRVDGPTLVAVLAGGFAAAEVEEFADSIHRDAGGEWDRLRGLTSESSLEELLPVEDSAPLVAAVEGRFSTGQWGVGYTEVPGGGLYQVIGANGPDPGDATSTGGGTYVAGPPDALTLVGGLSSFGGEGFSGALVTGFTPEATAAVRVTRGGVTLDASLGEPAPLLGGLRPWAAFFEVSERPAGQASVTVVPGVDPGSVVVVALDAAGAEIARTET